MKSWTRLALAAAVFAATVIGVGSASAAAPSKSSSVPSMLQVTPAAADPQTTPENLLVPITSCRIADTRVAGGPLHNGTTRFFYVSGTSGFSGQGGLSGGCGIPNSATAVAAVITAVTPTASGYITAFPSNALKPHSSVLNYPANITIGSGVTLPIQTGGGQSLAIFNYGGPTQFTIDVQGYYVPQIEALIGSDGSILSGTPRVVSTSHAGTGFYYITLDRPARQCAPNASSYNVNHYISVGLSSSNTPNVISVYTWVLDPTTHKETPSDYDFFIHVTC